MKALRISDRRFKVETFINKFCDEKHIEMFKESIRLYKIKVIQNAIVIAKLQFLIDKKPYFVKPYNDKIDITRYWLEEDAVNYFEYIYGDAYLLGQFDPCFEEEKHKKEYHKYIDTFKKYGKYFKKLCNKQAKETLMQVGSISQEYQNEDIVITDPCYFDYKSTPVDMVADTIYGDWGCTCYNKDTKEKIGKFCADGGSVCIAKLKDVLKYNPNFEKWMKEHDWCVTLIKSFTGTVFINYDIEYYEHKGKQCKDLYCYIEGKGNINFITTQTEF